MLNITDPSNCCGCTACASICSHHAITMIPDALGFLYPKIDSDRCVDCGLCDKVCQFHSQYLRYDNFVSPDAYQFRIDNPEHLLKSQSGGAFFSVAKNFISSGGVVYGAAFTDVWRVTHQRVSELEDLDKLRMSKYVQSDMRGVFKQVKNDLKNGFKVLFSGTACQVAGLKSYLPKKYHNELYCIDIICHGVPSPKIWDDYISYLQSTYQSKIVKACFRDKHFGWHGATESFLFANGQEAYRRTSNYLYFSGLSMRESCSKCYYTNVQRVGDISIGDQWGIPKDSKYEDNLGLSVVFVNSAKGKKLFELANAESVICEQVTLRECVQPQLQYPSSMHRSFREFRRDYEKHGFLFVAKKYGDMGWRYKIKTLEEKIKDYVRNILKK